MLIDQMSTEGWDPTEHPNTFKKSLKQLLSSRRRFRLEAGGEKPERENVVDLMEALKKSVGQARSKPARRVPARKRGAA